MPLSVIVEGQTEESFIEIGDRNPEDINDGVDTAPSRRLTSLVPSYRKPLHGPMAIAALGLPALREACPRFDGWVRLLESLAERTGK